MNKTLCLEVVELTRNVGDALRKKRPELLAAGISSKLSQQDLVTQGDKLSESLLVAGLQKLLPDAQIMAEESHTERKRGLQWIIDPIDGTTNFVQGIPGYCISIGLANGHELLMGVVLDVERNECFYSWEKSSAYVNGEPIKASQKSNFADCLIATGFSVSNHGELERNMAILESIIRNTRGFRRMGSAALDLCYIACGRFDAYFEQGLSAWDVAGGAFIAQGAGAVVNDYDNGDNFLFGAEIIAAPKQIMQAIQMLITDTKSQKSK